MKNLPKTFTIEALSPLVLGQTVPATVFENTLHASERTIVWPGPELRVIAWQTGRASSEVAYAMLRPSNLIAPWRQSVEIVPDFLQIFPRLAFL